MSNYLPVTRVVVAMNEDGTYREITYWLDGVDDPSFTIDNVNGKPREAWDASREAAELVRWAGAQAGRHLELDPHEHYLHQGTNWAGFNTYAANVEEQGREVVLTMTTRTVEDEDGDEQKIPLKITVTNKETEAILADYEGEAASRFTTAYNLNAGDPGDIVTIINDEHSLKMFADPDEYGNEWETENGDGTETVTVYLVDYSALY